MSSITMRFCNKVHPKLRNYISHYWYTTGEMEDTKGYQLLPMDHIDLIVQCKGVLTYEVEEHIIAPERVLFQGMRRKPIQVIQKGYCEVFGISFVPWGFYPFVNKHMADFTDRVVNLSEVNQKLAESITNSVNSETSINELIKSIETLLLDKLRISESYLNASKIFECLCKFDSVFIKEFCEEQGVNRRKFERDFSKYIGIGPKEFLRIRQFEASSRVLMEEENMRFTDIAYDSDYYDQPHFVRSFKEYSHHTPGEFKKDKPALKSNIKFE